MTPHHTPSRRRLAFGLLPPLVALAACTALPQAALIYSSRVSGGLDISGSATDTQGVSLSIGFKTTDLAYVPVAVGASAPGDGLGKVMPLTASYGEGTSNASLEKLPDENRERIEDYMQAKGELTKAQEALRRSQRALDKARAAAATAGSASAPSTAGAASPTADPNDLQKVVDEKKSRVTAAEQAAEAKLAEAAESIRMLQSQRTDAMSVYGKFNGLGSGNTAAASSPAGGQLTVGQVFSTGVAAQILTQAAQLEARSMCITRFKELVAQVPAASQAEVAVKVTEICPVNANVR